MPMMKCGCAAQGTCSKSSDGTVYDPPIPCCITHSCLDVADAVSLEGRTARCTHYGQAPRNNECDQCRKTGVCRCERPSSPDLAFFVFQGEGSPFATEICKCKMHKVAHGKGFSNCKCKEFVPQGPSVHDRFYCGCKSWN